MFIFAKTFELLHLQLVRKLTAFENVSYPLVPRAYRRPLESLHFQHAAILPWWVHYDLPTSALATRNPEIQDHVKTFLHGLRGAYKSQDPETQHLWGHFQSTDYKLEQ